METAHAGKAMLERKNVSMHTIGQDVVGAEWTKRPVISVVFTVLYPTISVVSISSFNGSLIFKVGQEDKCGSKPFWS
jgi:hypothetical protein